MVRDDYSTNEEEKMLPIKAKVASRKKRRNKPKDYPKRPLSAYNVFFRETREQILKTREEKEGPNAEKRDHKLDFQTMAKEIAGKWKELDPKEKERVEKLAKNDMLRYRDEVKAYEEEMVKKNRIEREEAAVRAAKMEEERREQEERTRKFMIENNEKEEAMRTGALSTGAGSLEALGALAGARLPAGANPDDPAVQEALMYYQQREMLQRQLLLEELRAAEEREMQIRRLQSLGLLQHDQSLSGLQGQQVGNLLGSHGAAGLLGGYGGAGLGASGFGGLGGAGGLSGLLNGSGLSHEMMMGAGGIGRNGAGMAEAMHLQQQGLLQEQYARLLAQQGGVNASAGAGHP